MEYMSRLRTEEEVQTRNKKHVVLLNKIVEELNKDENVDYIKETITFFSPVLYTKQNTNL